MLLLWGLLFALVFYCDGYGEACCELGFWGGFEGKSRVFECSETDTLWGFGQVTDLYLDFVVFLGLNVCEDDVWRVYFERVF